MYTAIRFLTKLSIMLHWFRTELKTLARGTLALAGLLWLIAAGAPCVMAQTPVPDPAPSHCPEHAKHKHQHIGHSAMPDCGPATTINCQLPDTGTPLAAGFGDFAMTPMLLTTLPAPFLLPSNGDQRHRHDFLTPDIPAPPLHIRYLTLLI